MNPANGGTSHSSAGQESKALFYTELTIGETQRTLARKFDYDREAFAGLAPCRVLRTAHWALSTALGAKILMEPDAGH